MNLPNKLTIFRVLCVPVFVVMMLVDYIPYNHFIAVGIFIIASLTDLFDGKIARKYNLVTNFGKFMDPLADKFTQISMLVMLTVKKIIPIWIVIVVFIKEFCMICGASFLYGKELVVSSKWYGKASTTLFYIAIVVSLILKELEPSILAKQAVGDSTRPLILYAAQPIYCIAIFMTIFSLGMYIKAFFVQGYLQKKA